MKDHTLEYPALGLEVFVAGNEFEERQFAEMFARASCRRAKSILEADLVVFTGGADVEPAYYGEKPHPETHFYSKRDDDDIGTYLLCLENGIPMLGICRGAQFLHVMNGGKLYQHVDSHYGDHPIWDIRNKKRIEKISSVHHQMVIPNKNIELIATGCRNNANGYGVSNERWHNPDVCDKGVSCDVEAFFIRDVCAVGIQGHPEYHGYNYFTKWSLDLIDELVCNNPDIVCESGTKVLRIKPELMTMRQTKLIASITSKETT